MANHNEVLTTRNYNLFKFMRGNRAVSPKHVEMLIRSMDEQNGGKYLPVPIIVNDKYFIIDGQHRIEACKRLGLPVYYIKTDDMGLRDVQKINSTAKSWNFSDHAYSYAELGKTDYKTFIAFREEFGFDTSVSVAMLADTGADRNNASAEFRNGLFKVKSLEYARTCAEKIFMTEKYYKGFKRRSFVMALLKLFKNKQYNHKQFLQKLEFNSSKMEHCTSIDQYIKLIEHIYNWKSQDKIRFF